MPTALIWGAAGGIGRSLTTLLTEEGWSVIAISRNPQPYTSAATLSLAADITHPAAVDSAVYSASLEVDTVDLYVYAAGDITQATVQLLKPDDWHRILDANLTGAYLTSRASLPLLAEKAHLVFIGAVTERLKLPSLSAYVAAKAGLEAFVATLAKEQRHRRITLVRPGAVDTPFWDKLSLKKPSLIATPAQIARRILDAHNDGHKGTLDIVH